ncbi:MAG: helix-turn-helix protein [uncultured archaeon A07HN63]|nr:MAG: helix-turn-helix protein [uncultured archaeon A07HN63]
MSRELLEDVRSLLLSLGITTQLQSRNKESYRLRISGDQFTRYIETVGFVTDRKQQAAADHADTLTNTNLDVVPDIGAELKRIREALDLTQADCNLPRSTYQHYERGRRNPSRESLSRVVEAFESALEEHTTTPQEPIAAERGVDTLESDVAALRQLADAMYGGKNRDDRAVEPLTNGCTIWKWRDAQLSHE